MLSDGRGALLIDALGGERPFVGPGSRRSAAGGSVRGGIHRPDGPLRQSQLQRTPAQFGFRRRGDGQLSQHGPEVRRHIAGELRS